MKAARLIKENQETGCSLTQKDAQELLVVWSQRKNLAKLVTARAFPLIARAAAQKAPVRLSPEDCASVLPYIAAAELAASAAVSAALGEPLAMLRLRAEQEVVPVTKPKPGYVQVISLDDGDVLVAGKPANGIAFQFSLESDQVLKLRNALGKAD